MKIKIDNTKCKNPDNCMKCVQICPTKIFVLNPTAEKSSYVKTCEIKVLFKDMCDACMKCVEVCPEKCISIEF
jgi:ferredoxin